jgi:very-short-patch-repair endonuclease
LRHGYSPLRLRHLAVGARGSGSEQMRRVAGEVTALAANPFESVARSIGLGVPGLALRPQVSIHEPSFLGRPDLVDERLRIIVECESFEFHGSREAFDRDIRRYGRLTAKGWLVVRFTYDDVMDHPEYVREILEAVVDLRANQLCPGCGVA